MNPHLYYALKYFCNQKVLNHGYGLGEEWLKDLIGICEFEVDSWECEGDEYRQKFTYYNKSFANLVAVMDNYHTQKLYEWLTKH